VTVKVRDHPEMPFGFLLKGAFSFAEAAERSGEERGEGELAKNE
jgi:hypothetical protein